MHDPFNILGVSPGTSDDDIRRRYLELVRQFPPDREPEKFAEVRAAYEQVRDPVVRLEAQLFPPRTADSFEMIQADLRKNFRARRLPLAILLSLAERP